MYRKAEVMQMNIDISEGLNWNCQSDIRKKFADPVTVGPLSRAPRRKKGTHVGHFSPNTEGRHTQKIRDDKAGLKATFELF